jgi:hypothetical protein
MARARAAIVLALAVAAFALGGCNAVVTKAPLFTDADASPHRLHDGIWNPEKAGCAVDEAKPVDAWPECADPVLVRRGELLAWQRDTRIWKSNDAMKALVVDGDPMILQVQDKPEGEAPYYLYAGGSPTLDARGRIVALQLWPVLCGPPPADAGATKPFPGIVLNPQGHDCTTGDPKALRDAAKASKASAKPEDLLAVHWVRDGER